VTPVAGAEAVAHAANRSRGRPFTRLHVSLETPPLLMPDRNGQSQPERTAVRDQQFDSERVEIDEKHFEGCTFDTCTLVYRGGVPPNFVRCDFAAPRFVFRGPAQSTIQLMSAIYNGIDERIIEKTFDEIRKGFGDG
jgi:hypothetical protein